MQIVLDGPEKCVRNQDMQSPSKLALVTLVSAATTTTGCYSTWDLTPQGVVGLNLFRDGDAVTMRSADMDEVNFTSSTKLIFHRVDGATREHRFRSITVDGPNFSGVDNDDGSRVDIDLSKLKNVQARNIAGAKTALVTTGIVAGSLLLGGILFYSIAATQVIDGRPLHVDGCDEPVGADLVFDMQERRLSRPHLSQRIDEATRQRIQMHWARATSSECASIPAFLALARDLRRASAPDNLVRAALRAAREEAVHTALCTNLVNAQTDVQMRAALPKTPAATDASLEAMLERLAIEAFWDGCVGEGAAATSAAQSGAKIRDAATRLAQQTITRDEAGHAELSRDVLAFCQSAGGRRVRNALGASLERKRALEEQRLSQQIIGDDTNVDVDMLGHYGVPSEHARREARAETWEKSLKIVAQV